MTYGLYILVTLVQIMTSLSLLLVLGAVILAAVKDAMQENQIKLETISNYILNRKEN